ncbi:MAG TPA: hypothetical protein DCS48_02430 [Desulfovibrio sp.]|nr:hypothetical protein [Desulfovibrio sp.]
MSRTSAVRTANKAWGDVPDWVQILAQTCDDMESQHQTAKKVRISPTAVNQVLKCKYPGNLGNVEDKVRASLMTDKVSCPVLGEIGSSQCLENQGKQFSAASSLKVQLWKACQGCEQNLNRKE